MTETIEQIIRKPMEADWRKDFASFSSFGSEEDRLATNWAEDKTDQQLNEMSYVEFLRAVSQAIEERLASAAAPAAVTQSRTRRGS